MKPRAFLELVGLTSGRIRRELDDLGIRRSRTSDAPVWILAGLLLVAAAVAIGAAATHSLSSEVAIGAATAVITVAGLLVAVLQWRAGLAEKAFDALYERIALANQMRLKASEGLETDDQSIIELERPNDYRFFVFTEIDSLEYAIERYRYGLGMTARIANRAIRHFRSRCRDPGPFREIAATCAEDGAYFEETKALVRQILARLDERAGEERPTIADVPHER